MEHRSPAEMPFEGLQRPPHSRVTDTHALGDTAGGRCLSIRCGQIEPGCDDADEVALTGIPGAPHRLGHLICSRRAVQERGDVVVADRLGVQLLVEGDGCVPAPARDVSGQVVGYDPQPGAGRPRGVQAPLLSSARQTDDRLGNDFLEVFVRKSASRQPESCGPLHRLDVRAGRLASRPQPSDERFDRIGGGG